MPRLLTTLCLILTVASLAPAADLAQLQASFMSRYDEANAERDQNLKKLETSYLGALKRHMDKVKASGDLTRVIPVRDEIEAIETGADPLPVLPDAAGRELREMRGKYLNARRKVVTQHSGTILELASKMDEALKAVEAELTKAGKIEEALSAKRMRETLAKDAGIKAAAGRLEAAERVGKAIPALRIRRGGDDLEVIVYYDRFGKLSMDSPVENVRESGERQGDTSAKVLGEFVGAEGYEVDPHVSYHHMFDDKDLGGLVPTSLSLTPGKSVEGRKGLGIQVQKDAENPRGAFGEVLPPQSSGGLFRLQVSYFIPKNNRVVAGLSFSQGGGGGPIRGGVFGKKGAWLQQDITARPTGDGGLLLYVSRNKDRDGDFSREQVFLGELKVEFIRFSASVVELLATSLDLKPETMLIEDGQFVRP